MKESVETFEFADWQSALSALTRAWRRHVSIAVKGWLGAYSSGTILDLNGEGAILLTRQSGKDAGRFILGRADSELFAGQLKKGVEALEASRDIAIKLSAGEVLRLNVTLPSVKYQELRGALAYELERISPIPPSQLYFDFQVTTRDPMANTATLAVRALRKDFVDRSVTLAHAATLNIAAILFEGDIRPADPNMFPIDKSARFRSVWKKISLPALLMLLATLSLMCVFAAYGRTVVALEELSGQLASHKIRAERVLSIRRETLQLKQAIEFLGAERRKPLLTIILRDATDAFPDGVWINQLEKNGVQISFHGYAQDARHLPAQLSQSGRFANVRFASPPAKDSSAQSDGFILYAIAKGGM